MLHARLLRSGEGGPDAYPSLGELIPEDKPERPPWLDEEERQAPSPCGSASANEGARAGLIGCAEADQPMATTQQFQELSAAVRSLQHQVANIALHLHVPHAIKVAEHHAASPSRQSAPEASGPGSLAPALPAPSKPKSAGVVRFSTELSA